MPKQYEKTMKSLLFYFAIILIVVPKTIFSQFASSYDSRTLGYVTPVKDQGLTCGACWAFASCAAIESSMIKQGFGTYDLSEDNLTDCHDFYPGPCDWGNYYITNSVLSKHYGILTESQDPYSTSLQDCPFSFTFPPSPVAYIEEIRFIPADINEIKQAILDYGAVASSMYFNSTPTNWDAANYKYYDASITAEDEPYAHCVTIVGWNDNLSFSGAPANGGWIIKDSYGTSWADNGYFYCSYYDGGILSSNIVFPSFENIPPSANTSHVYYYDDFGWVNNYGFSSNEAYALTKYTLLPSSGLFMGQQIKRIGTYAVEDNMSIEIELYRNKSGNILTDMFFSSSITCPTAGFYTIPTSLKTDSLNSDIYIKVKYTGQAGVNNPIPIEQYEDYSSTNFVATTNLCWISNDGNSWTQIGNGTSYDFDTCIKLTTENAQTAKMSDIPESACMMDNIILNSETMMPYDSLKWYINDIFETPSPNHPLILSETGVIDVKLIVWAGHNSDTTTKSIIVYEMPEQPIVSQVHEFLTTGDAYAYQWFLSDMTELVGETNQDFYPLVNGIYFVRVFTENGCFLDSEPYEFIAEDIKKITADSFALYPNPASDEIYINFNQYNEKSNQIKVYNYAGKLLFETQTTNTIIKIDISDYIAGQYKITVSNENITTERSVIKN